MTIYVPGDSARLRSLSWSIALAPGVKKIMLVDECVRIFCTYLQLNQTLDLARFSRTIVDSCKYGTLMLPNQSIVVVQNGWMRVSSRHLQLVIVFLRFFGVWISYGKDLCEVGNRSQSKSGEHFASDAISCSKKEGSKNFDHDTLAVSMDSLCLILNLSIRSQNWNYS